MQNYKTSCSSKFVDIYNIITDIIYNIIIIDIYSILILKVQNKPSSNICFENLFNYDDIDWTAIYMLPRLVTYNTYMRSFQYKILNNILYLNKKLHIFGIK